MICHQNKNLKDIFDFWSINSIRFLIILDNESEDDNDIESKIKIKDFQNKTESNIDIDNYMEYFESRLKKRH